MVRAVIFHDAANPRSRRIAEAMRAGIRLAGDEVELATAYFGRGVQGDVAIAYGWNTWHQAFEAYRAAGRHFVYIDLGFWGRKPKGRRLEGYHKVVVDAWHDEAFRVGNPPDRYAASGPPVQPFRIDDGRRYIVVAGMSAKSARTHGLQPEEWERWAIREIRRHTDRPIVYRPKPSWADATVLPGAGYSPPSETTASILGRAYAVVTHHSNLAVDAVIAGVPVFAKTGVAAAVSMRALEEIDNPPFPDDRRPWLADVAYCQWTPAEMEAGLCWRHIRPQVLS